MNGKTYHKLTSFNPNYLLHPKGIIGGLREDNGKVYIKYTNSDESLLYDFTLNVGDTVHSIAHFSSSMNPLIITKIETIQLLNGENRKLFKFDNLSYIEGIGCKDGLFGPIVDLCTCCPYNTSTLACYKSATEELYKDSYWCTNGNCFGALLYLDVPLVNQDKVNVTFSPNPATDFVKVEFADKSSVCTSLELMDFSGKRIRILPNPDMSGITLDLSTYRSGIYFVVVQYEGRSESHKLIKL